MSNSIVTQVMEKLSVLPDDLQRKVLEFVKRLMIPVHHGTSGKKLLKFAGSISPEDLQQMLSTIEIGCEKVDLNEW